MFRYNRNEEQNKAKNYDNIYANMQQCEPAAQVVRLQIGKSSLLL
jgi:hypothetical protein